jgi:hypothetical protein
MRTGKHADPNDTMMRALACGGVAGVVCVMNGGWPCCGAKQSRVL